MTHESSLKPWMYRKNHEGLFLFISLCLFIGLGFWLSLIDFWWAIVVLGAVILYVQLEQAKYLGNAVRVHKQQFPELYKVLVEYAHKLGIPKANLYIMQDPYLNAHAIGLTTCSVVLTSALVKQLSKNELKFIIGHELGHYAAGHTKISSLFIPLDVGNRVSSFIFGIWQRKTEYTCDQCGLILTRDLDAAISALIKLGVGGELFDQVNVEGYINQMKKADALSVKLSELLETHPLTTNRIKNVIAFWKEHFEPV